VKRIVERIRFKKEEEEEESTFLWEVYKLFLCPLLNTEKAGAGHFVYHTVRALHGNALKLGHDRFLPNNFQLITYLFTL
jgi:hypothetical protein